MRAAALPACLGAASAVLAGFSAPLAAQPRDPWWGEDIPFQWDPDAEGGPPAAGNPPLPQGFVLSYRVRLGAVARPAKTLNRYAEVGDALAACWAASAEPGDWRAVTLRLSFRRDGSINGTPRVQHLEAPGDAPALARWRASFLDTLSRCAPLRFSPSLGQAIAGQVFALRFVQQKEPSHG